jgi:hypothetical protein
MSIPADLPPDGFDAGLHLLDRQVVDPDGALLCKVDDLELTAREDGRLVLTALLVGPGALGPRLGPRLGSWVTAVWRRLRADTAADPQPGRISASELVSVDSAVHVAVRAAEGPERGLSGFEAWVHDNVIAKIPGYRHDPR